MKNCRSIEKKITAYLHGELNDREVQVMETHLETCGACRAALEVERATLELLGATLEAAPAPDQLSPWKKPVIRPRSLLAKIWFSAQLKAVTATGVIFTMLFLLSGSLVVFSVVKKSEMNFEPASVARPKAQLKKLQVPVNVSKGNQKPKPKLPKRVVSAQDDLFGDTSEAVRSMPDVAGAWSRNDYLADAGTSHYGVHAEPAAGAEFSAPARIARPKMKLKKPKVKVHKSATPASTTRIVTRKSSVDMPDIELPEAQGLKSGLSGAVVGYDMEPEADAYTGKKVVNTASGSVSTEQSMIVSVESLMRTPKPLFAGTPHSVEREPTALPSSKPKLTESFYFSADEPVPEPAPVPAAKPAEPSGRERYRRGVAAVEKGKGAPAVLAGRGAGLDDDNADVVILPELEEVTMFGSALAVADEPGASDALGVDYYGFMEEKEERSAGDGESAKKDVDKIGGVSSDSVSVLLFGVAEAEQPIVGSALRQDTALQEPGSRNPEKPDSSPVVLGDDMSLAEDVEESKDVGDRTDWLMRRAEPAVFNPYILAAENAFSTFSIDVDTASYGLARQRLLSGGLPEPEQVRTEEFINSFDYDYRPPSGKQTFSVHSEMAPSPFRMGMDALKIGIKGRRIGRDDHRGAVLTLVVDTSGSMSTPERLGLVKESLALLIDQLNPADSVAIVQFGNEARLVLEHTPVSEKPVLLDAINALQSGGPTQFDKGLALGYQLAESGFRAGDSNRIMILSDGVANLGELDPEAILQQVAEQRKQGIYLSVLGFGAGTYDDDMLERLANKGDGMYAYIDTLAEARHLLVDQLAATLHVIASDVKIQVEFNPERVLRYRQLGYENRQLTKEQFRDDTVDAGEVGSGQSVTALYDVELNPEGPSDEPIATVYVRYRRADNGAIEEISSRVTDVVRVQRFEDADARFQLSVCTAEFAERLRRSPYTEGTEIGEIAGRLQPVTLELALDGQVQELRQLISIAESLEK